MTQQNKVDINTRNNILPPILSSINEDIQACKCLEKLRTCMEYLPTFAIAEVESELLQWTLPVIKKSLLKIFDDNFLLSETADYDFVIDIIRQNFMLAFEFLQIENMILEFVTANGEVNLKDLSNFPVTSAEIVLLSFIHCKNSSEAYKTSFNVELLELFRITQTTHSLLLKLIETCIVVEELDNKEELTVLLEVLNIICNISESLFLMNFKSLTMNWKSYTGTIQKFSDVIKDSIDLKLPVQYLTSEILSNLKCFEEMEDITSVVKTTQVMKVINFLLKVSLKIFDVFWDKLVKLEIEILKFCSAICCFSVEYFGNLGHPPDFLDLLQNYVFQTIEPFFYRLTINDFILCEILPNSNISEINSYGFLIFLNIYLRSILESENNNFDLELLVNLIFESSRLYFVEYFWVTYSPKNIFDDLILNISACVLTSPHYYPKIEKLLLKNILQDNLWCSLLATEVWCLLLCNGSPQLREETLIRLIGISEKLNIGINTYRIEYVQFSNLTERLYRMLPVTLKMNFCRRYPINSNVKVWKLIGLRHYPDKRDIEALSNAIVENIEKLGSNNFNLDDFVDMTEKIQLLSTVDFNDLDTIYKNLSTAVSIFWELNYSNSTNNICRYFIDRLCKLTAAVIFVFNNKQLYNILNELKSLSTKDVFKLPICDILRSLSEKDFNDFEQDGYRIAALTSHILYPSLIMTENPLIKQNLFEVIEKFARTGKQDIIREVMKNSQNIQDEINNYLQRNATVEGFPREYYILLGGIRFQHQCCNWKESTGVISCKKIKIDDDELLNSHRTSSAKRVFPEIQASVQNIQRTVVNDEFSNSHQVSSAKKGFPDTQIHVQKRKASAVNTNDNKNQYCNSSVLREKSEEITDNNVTEAICNIKGEIKCLMNLLKTEKLSAKNVADLKILVSQLSSLM